MPDLITGVGCIWVSALHLLVERGMDCMLASFQRVRLQLGVVRGIEAA